MSIFKKYLEYCTDAGSADELSIATYSFLKSSAKEISLFKHTAGPDPLKLLESTGNSSLEECNKYFSRINEIKLISAGGENVYYFSSLNFQSDDIFFFAVTSEDTQAQEVLSLWQFLMNIYKKAWQASGKLVDNSYGNLISQFMHDIQSLIDSNDSKNKEVLKRIEYQEKLNKDLLFYIRDFDLFKTDIAVKSIVKDALKLINIDPESVAINIKNKDEIINVDVELFAQIFNALVKNAITATEGDVSKVAINIYSEPSKSPFLKEDWLIFEVIDNGRGIAEEFEPFISRPFFTTHKHNGHTGFGLTNSEKILKAHNGFLNVSTGNSTSIKIYLPRKKDEKK
jgi:signal transduction histidine kinase